MILITSKKLSSLKPVVPLLEKVMNSGKPLYIVADEIEGEALQALVLNRMKGNLNICAVNAPFFGSAKIDVLQDLATLCGAKLIGDSTATTLEDVELEDLGTAKKVIASRLKTTIVGGSGAPEKIQDRLKSLEQYLNDPTLEKNEKEFTENRLARLAGGVAVIKVGGATEIEVRERKDRVDDALNATRAAIEEGIVPGGGVALVRASQGLSEMCEGGLDGFKIGVEIVKKACQAPIRQISLNAGSEPVIVIQKITNMSLNEGYDAANDEFGDMIEAGIIDPVKVTRCALENAASVAGLMLTVDASIVEDTDD